MAIDSFIDLQKEMDVFQEHLRRVLEDRKLKLLQMIDGYKEEVRTLEIKQKEIEAQVEELRDEEINLEAGML